MTISNPSYGFPGQQGSLWFSSFKLIIALYFCLLVPQYHGLILEVDPEMSLGILKLLSVMKVQFIGTGTEAKV